MAQATPQLVDRGDLLAALDRAAARAVTIISAPAGSGKTTLLRAWADRQRQAGRPRLALVQLQRDQQDAQQFWLSLLAAVEGSGKTASAPTPAFNPAAMVDRVLAELAATGETTLIIDDLHELNSADALAQLTRLLTSLPGQAHAVLTTRHDLRLRLHQLRLAGELAEIRAADLRFTERETRLLLDAAGITLSAEAVALLHERTEGWAAGLRLAAISLRGHDDPERFVAEFSGSDRTVAEYLVDEMLERQPPDVQGLLLRTSILDQVNGELADLLSGRPGAERTLLALADANAFVLPLDPERTWFRYHHLFGDLLRLELRRTLPAEVPGLHRRAAGWFLRQGRAVDAIRHTQAAGDWPEAARLLADHSFSLTLDGQAGTMQALARAFPSGEDQPELALVRAAADLVQGRLDEGAAHLSVAESYARTAPAGRQRRLQVAIAALRLSLARRRGHYAGVIEQVTFLADPVSGQSDEDIALGSDLRAMALMNLGAAEAWTLGLPEAEFHLRQGAALARAIGRPYLEVGCLAQLGFAAKIEPFAVTQLRCREAIALAERYGWESEPVVAPALMTLAGTSVWLGEFDQAEHWLARTARSLQTDTGPDVGLLLHHTAGILHACRGRELEAALAEFTAADRLRSRLAGSHALASQVTGWLVATQARLGRPGEARKTLAAVDDERAASGEIGNARAVICLAEGDPSAALAALGPVLDGTAPVIGYVTLLEAHLLAARAHTELGRKHAADQAVERALALAEADRLVLPFALTFSADLLTALPRHETAHAALVAGILDAMAGISPGAGRPASPPAEELSPGELRVLRYLPTNLSRPEIASALSVSVNTVSTHVRSIYAKLQVRDRSSAVQRARELRLLAAARSR